MRVPKGSEMRFAEAFEVTLRLFPELPPDNFLHALREARAHLMYLRGLGAVERDVREGLEVWVRA